MMGDLLREEGQKLWATLELFATKGVNRSDFGFLRKNPETLNQLCKLIVYLTDNYDERAAQTITNLICGSKHLNSSFICLLLEEHGWEIEEWEHRLNSTHSIHVRKIVNKEKVRLILFIHPLSAEVRFFFYKDSSSLFANKYDFLKKKSVEIDELKRIIKDPLKYKK